MNVYRFDVGVTTHDALSTKPPGTERDVLFGPPGVLVLEWRHYVIAADSHSEAALLAKQWAWRDPWYVTTCLDVI